jgi:hypothetical protein
MNPMNEALPPEDRTIPLAAKERIDRICMAFEDAWKAGRHPRAEQYIETCSEAEQVLLLRELQRLESHYRGDEEKAQQGLFLPGQLIAKRYRIVGLLGRGGMGDVYRADDLKLGQPLALKFLPARLAGNANVLAYFHSEVRLARQIAHPNVCRVYDIGEVGGQHFLTMEYIDGEDLASLLRRIGRLPPDKGLAITRQMIEGLAAAHDRGILHRDLKPANVMLDGRGRVRIMDFGLACLSRTAGDQQLIAGTPLYMAPEQLAGQPVTVRSDLYSLGLVLYEIFTGRRPFEAGSSKESASARRRESPVPPSHIIQGIEPDVERVILRCLEKEPQGRPPSALAMLAALPGADTLSVAVAAGETPSPEMVAAAGQAGGLHPKVGGLCLVGVLLGLLAVAFLSDRTTVVGQSKLDSPHSLAQRAEEIVQRLGYVKPPADSACGFSYTQDRFPFGAIVFWYRQSSTVLVPQRFAGSFAALGDGTVSPDDPPPMPDEVSVRLTPRGRLAELRVGPSASEGTQPPATRSDDEKAGVPAWSIQLLREAGLTAAVDGPGSILDGFTTSPVKWAAPVDCDSKQSWQGHYPDGNEPVHVRAAALGERPVYFGILSQEQAEHQPLRSSQPSAVRAYGRSPCSCC